MLDYGILYFICKLLSSMLYNSLLTLEMFRKLLIEIFQILFLFQNKKMKYLKPKTTRLKSRKNYKIRIFLIETFQILLILKKTITKFLIPKTRCKSRKNCEIRILKSKLQKRIWLSLNRL